MKKEKHWTDFVVPFTVTVFILLLLYRSFDLESQVDKLEIQIDEGPKKVCHIETDVRKAEINTDYCKGYLYDEMGSIICENGIELSPSGFSEISNVCNKGNKTKICLIETKTEICIIE